MINLHLRSIQVSESYSFDYPKIIDLSFLKTKIIRCDHLPHQGRGDHLVTFILRTDQLHAVNLEHTFCLHMFGVFIF